VRKKKRDKGLASQATLSPATNARSAGILRGAELGSKTEGKTAFVVKTRKSRAVTGNLQGSNPEMEVKMSQKVKFAFYLPPEKKEELERRYREDGSRSITAFVENAVNFYLDYLSANNAGAFLPAAVKSVIEGRLGMLEDRLASLLFKQTVEQDMAMSIIAGSFELDEEYMRRQRGRSIANVKQTNGRLSFESIARNAGED
jgi:hypothetical protein